MRLKLGRLKQIVRSPWMDLDDVTNDEIAAMADEIADRRARDLSSDELEVLFMMLRDLRKTTAYDDATWYEPGLELLDRLLSTKATP